MQEVYPEIFLIREKRSMGAIKPLENLYVLAGNDGYYNFIEKGNSFISSILFWSGSIKLIKILIT